MKRLITLFSVLILTISLPLSAAEHEIKTSVLAPEGSTWVKVLEQMSQELQQKSNGRLALKLYPGGVSGDEKDVIRKMRIGQVHAAAFTGVGLGQIVPSIRVLELPMLFRNYKEVDFVKTKLAPQFEKDFAAKGFINLGWAENGFVYIFSNKAIANLADMKGVKMWAWEGDPLVETMYKTLGITPIPLSLPDVLTSLQTNLIDGVYGPPLGIIALQWFTKVKNMTNLPLANSTGALLVSSKVYGKLPADLQKILKATAKKYSAMLVQKIRTENKQAIDQIKKAGIQIIEVDPKAKAEIVKVSESVYPKLAGKLYSPALLQQVETLLRQKRGQ